VDIVEDYRNRKPEIINYVRDKGIKDIPAYAALGAVPLYAIWSFIE